MNRDSKELVRRIYEEQIRNPSKGDFIELIKSDFQTISEVQDDKKIANTTKNNYKKYIKNCIRNAAFKYLTDLQSTHSKVRELKYQNLETQKYMITPIFTNEEVSMLHALRSKTTKCKANFKFKYSNEDLFCTVCHTEIEEQQHLLKWEVLKKNSKPLN